MLTENSKLESENPTVKAFPRFAVFYIDKHVDPVQSQWVTSAMSQCFKLQAQHRVKLSSGEPILIRSSLPISQASKIKQAISKLGGCSWIQPLNSKGLSRERRLSERRSGYDRRALGRTNLLTDRRCHSDVRKDQIL